MPTHQNVSVASAGPRREIADLPLVVEQLLAQLEALQDVAQAQQRVLERLAARLDAVERR